MRSFENDLAGFRALDFDCLVSDYGTYFARLGAEVTIYDEESRIRFAAFSAAAAKPEQSPG